MMKETLRMSQDIKQQMRHTRIDIIKARNNISSRGNTIGSRGGGGGGAAGGKPLNLFDKKDFL